MNTSLTFRKSRSNRARARGVASVEAVIVLPFFILVLVSLLYVRDQAIGKQAAEMHARSCAWLYSANDCDEIPPGCADVLSPGDAPGLSSPEVAAALGNSAERMESIGGVVETVVGALVGPALEDAFGRSLDARTSRDVTRPGVYGGGTKSITGRYHLACNLSPTTPEKVVEDAWRGIRPW